MAATEPQPGVHLPAVEPKRQRGAEGHRRILAPIVVHRRVAHLDRAVLDGVEHLQAGNDLARCEGLNHETIVGEFGNTLAEVLASAKKRIQRLRPTRRKPPFELGHGLCDRW